MGFNNLTTLLNLLWWNINNQEIELVGTNPPQITENHFNVNQPNLPILDKYTDDEKDLYFPLQKDVDFTKIGKRTQDKSIYVDAACLLYQYVKDNRLEEGLNNFIIQLKNLRKPFVFVMDNPEFKNSFKEHEGMKRSVRKRNLKYTLQILDIIQNHRKRENRNVEELKSEIEDFRSKIDEIEKDMMNEHNKAEQELVRKKIKYFQDKVYFIPCLLNPDQKNQEKLVDKISVSKINYSFNNTDDMETLLNMENEKFNTILNEFIKLNRKPRSNDYDLFHNILKKHRIQCVFADHEADFFIHQKCKEGLVSACITNDTDLIGLGIPYVYIPSDYYQCTFTEYNHQRIIQGFGLNRSQFIYMNLLSGSDFTPTSYMKGVKLIQLIWKDILKSITIQDLIYIVNKDDKDLNSKLLKIKNNDLKDIRGFHQSLYYDQVSYTSFEKKKIRNPLILRVFNELYN